MTPPSPDPDRAAVDLDTQKLTVARLWAVERHPYLTSALFALTVVPTAGLGRMATDDRWRLYVDPNFVEDNSIAVLGSLLVHQVGHLVRDHATRAEAVGVDASNRRDWATAADAEINDDLVSSGLRLPEDRIVPEEQGWARGRLAEEYFHAGTTPDPDADEAHPDCGSGADGETRDWELSREQSSGLPPSQQRLVRAQVASQVLRHAREGRGRLSGGWQRWAEQVLEPRVDWRRALAAEVRKGVNLTTGRVDYTYRRPSRRAQACPGVILPAMEQPDPHIAVVCDTSGSMTDEILAAVLAEVEGILSGIGTARRNVRVLSVDAEVQAVERVSQARSLNLAGGGGTDMGAGLVAAARLRPRPSAIVVLTDGLTPWPDAAPGSIPVVVGLVGGLRARGSKAWSPPPWARTVTIDLPMATGAAARVS